MTCLHADATLAAADIVELVEERTDRKLPQGIILEIAGVVDGRYAGTVCDLEAKIERLRKELFAERTCSMIRNKRYVMRKAEIERLRNCEEIKLVEFLTRPEIHVWRTRFQDAPYTGEFVVQHQDGLFEGRAKENVIGATRAAMLAEERLKATKAEEE